MQGKRKYVILLIICFRLVASRIIERKGFIMAYYSVVVICCDYCLDIRECGSTLYVGMTRTAVRAAYRLIQK